MELGDEGDEEPAETDADDDFADLALELEDDADSADEEDDFEDLGLELEDEEKPAETEDDNLENFALELEDDEAGVESESEEADDDFGDLELELEDESDENSLEMEDEDGADDLALETESEEAEDDFEEFGLELESEDDEDNFGELALDFDDKDDNGTDFEETVGLDAFEMEDQGNEDDQNFSQIDETIDKPFTSELEELSDKEEPALEFEYEPDEPETTSQPDPQVSEKIAEAETEAETIPENEIEEDPMIADIKSKLVWQKKILSPILLLLILIFGGFAYFFYTDQQIPFIGGFFGSGDTTDENDLGNQRASTVEDKGYYVTRSDGALLFVIEGKVRNDYAQPRSYFKVKGKLYAKNKAVLQEQKVSAGNILTKSELESLSMEEITSQLNNVKGSDKQNTNIKTSQKVPFMIVFSKLDNPDALEEYSIEVASSMPGN